MVNLQSGDLTIEVDERTPGVLVATWLGRSNHRNPASVLHPWFDRLFSSAREQNAAVELRFERVEHFNSSTIAVVIQLITSAQDRGLKLTVRYDGNARWQTLSFEALQRALRPYEQVSTSVKFVAA